MMRLTTLARAMGMAAVIGIGATASAQAQAISCGGTYTIKSGDTLQRVTNRAYGPGNSYGYLYKANRDVVGANPSAIEIGLVIRVPCKSGQKAAAATAASAQVAAAAPTPAATPVAARSTDSSIRLLGDRKLRFVTGTDWAPFQNQDQEQGGMITEIMRTAMNTAVGEGNFKIDFINDYASHLQILIADGAYDFAFGWFRPNCDVIDKLGEGSQFRCKSLAWSDPVFEQIISYYMRADDPAKPATHAGLFSRTLCRPRGYAEFMMEEKDLKEPRVTIMRPPTTAECFELLLEGQVDAVVLASTVADDAIMRVGGGALIEEQPQLATVATLHVVTSVNNPDKERQLAIVNSGIRSLRESGKWFDIVQRHLIAHARLTANN